MKKIPQLEREYCKRQNILKLRIGIKRASIQKNQKLRRRLNKNGRIDKRETFYPPELFSLNGRTNRGNLLDLIRSITSTLYKTRSNVFINFKNTKTLHPCGTLYFSAHISLLAAAFPGKITCSYPDDDVVGQLFQHIGLLRKLNLSDKYKITADNVKDWHSVEGFAADGQKFESLLKSIEDELTEPIRMGLYESMTEAVLNSRQHAYDRKMVEQDRQYWWMFARKDGDVLTVAVYDAGIGIPGSLRKKPELIDIMKGLSLRSKQADKKLIAAAVGSKSSTRLPWRGKGLPDMMDFIKSTHVGGILIHSNRGSYYYAANTEKEMQRDYETPVAGTLIQWSLPLVEREETK
jgi:hypothetical protein